MMYSISKSLLVWQRPPSIHWVRYHLLTSVISHAFNHFVVLGSLLCHVEKCKCLMSSKHLQGDCAIARVLPYMHACHIDKTQQHVWAMVLKTEEIVPCCDCYVCCSLVWRPESTMLASRCTNIQRVTMAGLLENYRPQSSVCPLLLPCIYHSCC